MKTLFINIIFLFFLVAGTLAQVGINSDGSNPDPSAGLDVKFTNKGMLIPRLTYDQQQAIINPAQGLMIFCTNCTQDGALSIFSNGSWKTISACNISSPPEGQHTSTQTQITWNWNQGTGASGYRWNTTNDYTSAIDMGTSTTHTETNLLPGMNYTRYVWAYSSCGISSATALHHLTQPLPFACGSVLADARDNKTYNTVKIGTQCWIAQNMNVGVKISMNADQVNNSVIEKYCYDNLESNCEVYGGLYQWNEFMNYTTSSSTIPSGRQGICPAGWHIPSNAEFSLLTSVLGGENLSGGAMKEAGLTHWASPNFGATNSSGFTALPGGMNSEGRSSALLSYYNFLWTTTENASATAWLRQLSHGSATILNISDEKVLGLSARCIQD